jgi:sugar transferase (PEP-CTERM system associated)
LLAILELVVYGAAALLAVEVRFYGAPLAEIESLMGSVFPKTVLFADVMLICGISMGLYKRSFREGASGMLVRIGISFILAMMVMSAIFYVLPSMFLGRGVLGLAFLFSLVGIGMTRGIFLSVVSQDAFKRQVLVLGTGKRAASLAQLRRRVDFRGFRIVGFIHIRGEQDLVDKDRIVESEGSIMATAMRHEADEIVVAMDDRRRGFPVKDLLDCKMSGIEVVDLLTFFERETGKIRLDCLHPSWMIFSDGFGQSTVQDYIKRVFDVGVSSLLLLLTAPAMIVTALLIKLEDGGPIFFKQVRVGLGGREFEVIKFRSMRVDAERDGKAQWAQKNDSRVTRLGNFIRKVRIDELPQVFNVFRGEMSFVGPRPERPQFVQQLSQSIEYYSERHRVKPGITGWAQIRYPYGASEKDALEKLQYDLYYAKNHNLFLDLTILLHTAEVIIFGQGAR